MKYGKVNSSIGTQKEKGVGLGLQLVFEFVKNCGASIKVEGELGKGTCFMLTFNNKQKGNGL